MRGGNLQQGLLRLPVAVTRRRKSTWVALWVALLLLIFHDSSVVVVVIALSAASSSKLRTFSNKPSLEDEGIQAGDVVHTLLLCRHGDSIWNGGEPGTKETFTGWTNVPLSRKGIQEAKETGKQVAEYFEQACYSDSGSGSTILDACFTSILQRAQLTAHYCLWGGSSGCDKPNHPFVLFPPTYVQDYRLNERHYGALQGFVKEHVEQGLYGHEPQLVRQWRKSWSAVPPLLDDDNDPRRMHELQHYASHCGGPEHVPRGESLEQVANQRIRPFLKERVCPTLQQATERRKQNHGTTTTKTTWETPLCSPGGTGLVVAHANSLRALIGVICNVQEDPIALHKLELLRLQTGVPLVLRFRVLSRKRNDHDRITIDDDYLYQPCDLDGIPFVNNDGESSSKRRLLVPELPLYPLSGVPFMKKSTTTMSQPKNRLGSMSEQSEIAAGTEPPVIGAVSS